MTNENPQIAAPADAEEARRAWNAQRLEDRLNAQGRGKALQIVVRANKRGTCRVCNRRSATVAATKTQALAWFTERKTDGFRQWEVRLLETGVHQKCQRIEDQKKKAKAARGRKNDDVFVVPLEAEKVERIMARRRRA